MKLPKLMCASTIKFSLALCVIGSLLSCDTETEEIEIEKPESYTMPLQVGKYVIYRLDSIVFVQAGRKEEIHSYQEKNSVDAQITDNLGRVSYRIFRYLRNVSGTSPWVPAGTYTITPLSNSLEVIENNMRKIALTGPIKEGHTWKGNRFFGPEPYASFYTFSNDDNLNDWNFVIESIGQTDRYNNGVINDIITVTHEEELTNVPVNDSTSFASKTISLDKYARGIGLVYQEHVLWEFQPNPGGTPYSTGFGIKRSLLEHN